MNMFTVAEVAVMLRKPPAEVRAMARKAQLPAAKLGPRQWRFPQDAMDRWIAALPNGHD